MKGPLMNRLRYFAVVSALLCAPIAYAVMGGETEVFLGNTYDSIRGYTYKGTAFLGGAGRIHAPSAAAAPAAGTCGTNPAIATGSVDTAGGITTGTGSPASCAVTFSAAYTVAPTCVVTDQTTATALKATTSTTALTITQPASADVVSWVCIGH